jgi:hypothetical protein
MYLMGKKICFIVCVVGKKICFSMCLMRSEQSFNLSITIPFSFAKDPCKGKFSGNVLT